MAGFYGRARMDSSQLTNHREERALWNGMSDVFETGPTLANS